MPTSKLTLQSVTFEYAAILVVACQLMCYQVHVTLSQQLHSKNIAYYFTRNYQDNLNECIHRSFPKLIANTLSSNHSNMKNLP